MFDQSRIHSPHQYFVPTFSSSNIQFYSCIFVRLLRNGVHTARSSQYSHLHPAHYSISRILFSIFQWFFLKKEWKTSRLITIKSFTASSKPTFNSSSAPTLLFFWKKKSVLLLVGRSPTAQSYSFYFYIRTFKKVRKTIVSFLNF